MGDSFRQFHRRRQGSLHEQGILRVPSSLQRGPALRLQQPLPLASLRGAERNVVGRGCHAGVATLGGFVFASSLLCRELLPRVSCVCARLSFLFTGLPEDAFLFWKPVPFDLTDKQPA